MKTALTIAGSDSSAGAGIQADLKTFAAHGVYGVSAITAVTAQNTMGVTSVHMVPADIVTQQIEAVAGDIAIHATKIGMLANAAIVEAVAAAIAELELPLVVLDPVMIAKSGDTLLDADAIAAMKSELIGRATIVTPNAAEAASLAGCPVRTLDEAREAAARIHRLGARAVLVKGGHLETDEAIDVFYDGHAFHELTAPRIATRRTHGTGCTLSSAIAAHLACGAPLGDAVALAKRYVTGAIAHGLAIGGGHGPLDHFWNGVGRYT